MRRVASFVSVWVGLFGLGLVVAATGCGGSGGGKTETPAVNVNGGTTQPQERTADGQSGLVQSPAAVQATGPLSDDECKDYGQAVADALNANDIDRLNVLVDWNSILSKALEGLPQARRPAKGDEPDQTTTLHDDFIHDISVSLNQPEGFWPQIIHQAGAGNPEIARFLHLHGGGDRRAVLIRVILPESVTYLDLVVARRQGEARAIDCLSFLSGELLSRSLRQSYVQILAQQAPAEIEGLSGWELDLARNVGPLGDMATLLPAKPKEWLAAYARLPANLRKEKSLLHTRVSSARIADDEQFIAAIADLKAAYPNDPSVDLVLVDLYAEGQQYPEADLYLRKLNEELGGDPYLKVWLGNVMLAQNRYEDARKILAEAVGDENTLRHGYWSLVMLSLAEKRFDQTVSSLKLLEDKFQVEFDDFSKHPEYAEFLRSPEYQTWIKLRSAQVPPTNSLR